MERRTIAIVGAGASGTLLASLLVGRSETANVVIVDPCERLGRGVAYSTDSQRHTLNVPAAKMSALVLDRDHFVRWLAENAGDAYGPSSFVPRSVYGDYLADIASAAQTAAPDRWRHERASAIEVRLEHDGVHVTCSNGAIVRADRLVIATGNASPAAWPNMSPDARQSPRYFGSAWIPGALTPETPDDSVVLLGTGLTAVDALFGLHENGFCGSITMVSRRGLLPHEHTASSASASRSLEANTASGLLGALRGRVRETQASGGDWRACVDALRPHTNAMWKALSLTEQRRFLRHALPYWNVHRHRMPPEAAKAVTDAIAAGRLRVLAGRTGAVTTSGDRLRVPVELRGSHDIVTIDAGRVINCSGPQTDVRRLEDPFVRSLLAHGLMVPSMLGIGMSLAENGALVGSDGHPASRLFAIGPARFGTLIETTAMPDIREQAHDLASLLAG